MASGSPAGRSAASGLPAGSCGGTALVSVAATAADKAAGKTGLCGAGGRGCVCPGSRKSLAISRAASGATRGWGAKPATPASTGGGIGFARPCRPGRPKAEGIGGRGGAASDMLRRDPPDGEVGATCSAMPNPEAALAALAVPKLVSADLMSRRCSCIRRRVFSALIIIWASSSAMESLSPRPTGSVGGKLAMSAVCTRSNVWEGMDFAPLRRHLKGGWSNGCTRCGY
mmetsp:Transcript_53863/g.167217  ORF Transcript_53863/g.167217 Transcript_53863/m.167217 type:complete len:228 (-) Transcript_53863:8-691(-)